LDETSKDSKSQLLRVTINVTFENRRNGGGPWEGRELPLRREHKKTQISKNLRENERQRGEIMEKRSETSPKPLQKIAVPPRYLQLSFGKDGGGRVLL